MTSLHSEGISYTTKVSQSVQNLTARTQSPSQPHQRFSKFIPSVTISTVSPEGIIGPRILDKVRVSGVQEFLPKIGVLLELELKDFVHLGDSNLKPVRANVSSLFMGFVESRSRSGTARPDTLGDVWVSINELHRLEEMFASRIHLSAIQDRMRREIGESIIGATSIVELDLLRTPRRGFEDALCFWLRPGTGPIPFSFAGAGPSAVWVYDGFAAAIPFNVLGSPMALFTKVVIVASRGSSTAVTTAMSAIDRMG